MRNHLLILLFLSILLPGQLLAKGNKIRPKIQVLATEIAKSNYVADEIGGFGSNGTPIQYKRFLKLKKKATTRELILLTNYKNAVVKYLAFDALTERKNVDFYPIIMAHIFDTAKVTSLMGCFEFSESISEHFFADTPLLPTQKHYLDSLVLYADNIPAGTVSEAIRLFSRRGDYHSRIRELYLSGKYSWHLSDLAKYKKDEDKQFILDALQDDKTNFEGVMAAIQFPDSSFYPSIEKIREQSLNDGQPAPRTSVINGMIYEYILFHPTPRSKAIILSINNIQDKEKREDHSLSFHQALKRNPVAYFNDVKESIRLTDKQKEKLANNLY